jgi:hypothetical protein
MEEIEYFQEQGLESNKWQMKWGELKWSEDHLNAVEGKGIKAGRDVKCIYG